MNFLEVGKLEDSLHGRQILAKMKQWGKRRPLPDVRQSITHKFEVGGTEAYMTVGLYDNGQPGEIYIKTSKEGSTMRGMFEAFGQLTSNCLQYGVPVEKIVGQLRHTRFEPSGKTANPDIENADSLVDYISQWLEHSFLNGNSNGYRR